MLNQLDEEDFNLWTEQIAIAIERRNIDEMDWNNLLEEIDNMGKSEKRFQELKVALHKIVKH
ncbi:MAG: DUF29 domain-containing protein [Pleurocapsa sp. CRU_1_2]|nr:DUF29 domain-containing protein [Pleurocapsa sp. CRU_1_2]